MSTVNKVILVGYLGADPEVRSAGNSQVANLRLATTDTWKDRDGNKQERTEWHRISAWGHAADFCERYLRRGSLVYVEGSLQTRKWQADDGSDRYSTEIKAWQVNGLDRKGSGDNAQRPATAPKAATKPRPQSSAPPAAGDGSFDNAPPLSDEDIPF